jgi:hypothetical protein
MGANSTCQRRIRHHSGGCGSGGTSSSDRETAGGTAAPRAGPPAYLEVFRVAPGCGAELTADELQAASITELVLVLRGSPPVQAFWVPVSLANYGVCGRCLLWVERAALLRVARFLPGEEARVRENQLVCAPPICESQAVLQLAALVRHQVASAPETLADLRMLAALTAWTPERAAAILGPLLARLTAERDEWVASTQLLNTPPPRANWAFYQGEGGAEYTNVLTMLIQRHARRLRAFAHAAVLPPDQGLYEVGCQLAALAVEQHTPELERVVRDVFSAHPTTFELALKKGFTMPRARAVSSMVALVQDEMKTVCGANGEAPTPGRTPTLNDPGGASFVFSLAEAWLAARLVTEEPVLHHPELAETHLNEYLGGYLPKLDLGSPARSYITGSAAMSSALRPGIWTYFGSHREFLASYYPPLRLEAQNPTKLRAFLGKHFWVESRTFTQRQPAAKELAALGAYTVQAEDGASAASVCWDAPHGWTYWLPCVEKKSADVDIAVDADTDEAFDATAHAHFRAIHAIFSNTELVREERGSSEHSWRIRATVPAREAADAGFREVEIYRATWSQICTHHVAPVRLAYTAPAGAAGPPCFMLTATCVLAAVTRSVLDYYYFSSRRTLPQEIILKYAARGYPPGAAPEEFRRLGLEGYPPQLSYAILSWARSGHAGADWRIEAPGTWLAAPTWDWAALACLPALSVHGRYNLAALATECALALRWGAPANNSTRRPIRSIFRPRHSLSPPLTQHAASVAQECRLRSGDLVCLYERPPPGPLVPDVTMLVLSKDAEYLLPALEAAGARVGQNAEGTYVLAAPVSGAWQLPLIVPDLARYLRALGLWYRDIFGGMPFRPESRGAWAAAGSDIHLEYLRLGIW